MERQRQRRAENPEKTREEWRKAGNLYYERHPERILAGNKRRRAVHKATNPERLRLEAIFWRNHYAWGLTREVFESFRNRMDGPCEICGATERMHIDHDHGTNAFRGLLCRSCNHMLGFAHDRIDVLQRGIEYLKKHGSQAA